VGPTGTLFAAWRHVYPGNLRDIAFTSSTDAGATFAPIARVSEDRWQLNGCPDDGPAMAIDADGTVHLVWPTVLGGPEPQGALFYSTSRDGGRTFTQRVRVPTQGSPKPAHPQIAIDRSGHVLIAWDEVIGGVRRAYVREAWRDPSRAGEMSFGAALAADADAPSMYPVLAVTPTARVLVWTSGAAGATVIKVRGL
jgi:hypothetical protein